MANGNGWKSKVINGLLSLVLLGGGWFSAEVWGQLQAKVDKPDLIEVVNSLKITTEKADTNQRDIIAMKGDIKRTREDVKEVKVKVESIDTTLNQMKIDNAKFQVEAMLLLKQALNGQAPNGDTL